MDQIKALVDKTVETYGKLDYAFNNAGVAPMKPITEMNEEEWDQTIDVNLKGVYFGIKYEIEEMLKNGGGAYC